MLKGSMANIVILIGLLFTLAVLFYDVSPFWYEGQREDAILHRDLYMMNNSLMAAKSYMDTAFSYSVYQACYDVLRSDVSGDESEFKSALEKTIRDYLNRYRADDYYFMTNYPVTISEYSKVTIETLDPLKVKAESDSNIFISMEDKGAERRLETGNRMEKTIPIDCYTIYKKGIEINESIKNTLESSIKTKMNSWPDTTAGSPNPTELPNLDDLKKQIETIPELAFEKTESNYNIKSEFSESKVEISGYEQSSGGPYENIKYKVNVKLNVTVNDTRSDQVFPVYNGAHITFSSLSMLFVFDETYSE